MPQPPSRKFPSGKTFPSLLAGAALAVVPAFAQITFTPAFPGLTFVKPVYFGVFPGKEGAFVVLEQHSGHVLIVSEKEAGWGVDTLWSVQVHQNVEMGLLGIAFHPQFKENRRYFVSYDPPEEFSNVVEERLADETLLKDAGGAGKKIFDIEDPYSNHNGGTIAFGPKDGLLYFGTGDGGSFTNDPLGNGQNKDVLLAKMLRVDVDGQDEGLPYAIPADNPFAAGGGRGEVFAYGLRNPFKWSFDPVTGDLWLGDVGYSSMEEVDVIEKGGNYGWKIMEGTQGTPTEGMKPPVFAYGRNDGTAVIGGQVFRGSSTSKYYGSYFFTDYYSKNLWTLSSKSPGATATKIMLAPAGLACLGADRSGRLYACGHTDGVIYRLESQDLQGSTVGVHQARAPRGSAGSGRFTHLSHLSAGQSLPPKAFASASMLEVYSPQGRRVGSLTRERPRVPQDWHSGLFFLVPAGGGE